MFGNLVESSSHKGDNARKSWFFLGTLGVYAVAFLAVGVGSIYAYNTHVEAQNLELISMVAPVEAPAEVQPAPRPSSPRPAAGGGSSRNNAAVVRETPVTAVMDPTRVENKAMVSAPVAELPPGTAYKIGTPGPGDNIFGGPGNKPGGDPSGRRGSGGPGGEELEAVVGTPPPAMEKKAPKPPTTVSKGVINGMATYLPKPVYSALAKTGHAAGVVTVQVLIDEYGKVVSARAISGHPLLQREAVQAAYLARFTPTLLSNQPVKVSGVITYNFVRQ